VRGLAGVEECRFRGQAALTITSGELSATFLPDLGLTGVSLRHRGREHQALPGGIGALRSGATLGLPLLAPWANRLRRQRDRAAGVDVDLTGLALRTDRNGLPMHGLLVGRAGWRIERHSARGATARFRASIDIDAVAFPFPHRIEVGVAASADRLVVETTLVPTGRRRVPAAFGWHPYLRLPDAPRSRWRLRLPSRTHLALDGHGIPTGVEAAAPHEADRIGGRTFDDLYRLGGRRELAIEADDGSTIAVRPGQGYAYAQLWVPERRPFAALEPMVVGTNSLVQGDAPLVRRGESFSADFSIIVGAPG
jgi:galactose mutarotase-like enzyme